MHLHLANNAVCNILFVCLMLFQSGMCRITCTIMYLLIINPFAQEEYVISGTNHYTPYNGAEMQRVFLDAAHINQYEILEAETETPDQCMY